MKLLRHLKSETGFVLGGRELVPLGKKRGIIMKVLRGG